MDTQKIGTFLKQLRKEHDMTQEQLGERIGVTNKTVSRWENGNYMPPIESLLLLSELYHISINEILAGEYIADEDIKSVADKNVSAVLGELQQENQKFEGRMRVIMILTTILCIGVIILLPIKGIKDFVILLMVVAITLIANMLNFITIALKKG